VQTVIIFKKKGHFSRFKISDIKSCIRPIALDDKKVPFIFLTDHRNYKNSIRSIAKMKKNFHSIILNNLNKRMQKKQVFTSYFTLFSYFFLVGFSKNSRVSDDFDYVC